MERKAYPSEVSDDAWALVAPYWTRMTEAAPPRDQSRREVLPGLRWSVRAGAAWRMLPHALPPWSTVYPPRQRGLTAGVLAALVHDLRALLRGAQGRHAQPAAALCASHPLPATPESGTRAG
jgi:transposase